MMIGMSDLATNHISRNQKGSKGIMSCFCNTVQEEINIDLRPDKQPVSRNAVRKFKD